MPTRVFFYVPPPLASGVLREAHPYGPTATGFHTDFGLDINPAETPNSPALAVVNGFVRVIPEGTPSGTVALTLQPAPWVVHEMATVVGASVIVFIYRNVDVPTVRARFQTRIEAAGDAEFLTSEPLDLRVDRFLAGEYPVFVHGGDDLGIASTVGGTDSWARLGFEIAYVPGGLGDDLGWPRLASLLATSELRTRRLDPAAFYRAVNTGTSSVSLDPSHAGHALLTVPSRRSILEVRDEYDLPLVGSVEVTSSTSGLTTSVALPAGARGHAVLATAPTAEAEAPTADYTLASPNRVITSLPSGASAEFFVTRTLTAPAHWAVQQIFMDSVNDPANWFVANTPPLPRFTEGNRVTPLIDGIDAFVEMVHAMRTVTAAGHSIRLAGWWLTDSFQLLPGATGTSFRELATAMAAAGADVHALLWDQWGTQNSGEVDHINALPGGHGHAILDNETFKVGSHHQKLLVVDGEAGALAFCGGVDINPDRLDTPEHRAASPFHDVHAKVEGPAVADLNHTFVQRWNAHPTLLAMQLPETPPPFAPSPSTHYVQVSRTFPPSFGYPFVLPGEDIGTLKAVRRAIMRAQRFIYIEDQYMTPYPGSFPFVSAEDSVGILKDLLTTLARPSFEYLVMVMPNITTVPQMRYRRRNFIRSLRDAFPTKVFPFFLARVASGGGTGTSTTAEADVNLGDPLEEAIAGHAGPSGGPGRPNEIYVHTKAWLIDDVYAKIGSANVNRRSMTHDTEIDIHVIDGALTSGARRMARDFRLTLWGELLNLRGRTHWLEDPTHALHFWQQPPTGSLVRPYDENAGVEAIHTDVSWNNFIDPDGR